MKCPNCDIEMIKVEKIENGVFIFECWRCPYDMVDYSEEGKII